jgi:uncharacterized coiled-coil DUF342 family protein
MFYLMVTTEDNDMLSINNNNYDYNEREKKVLELYREGRNTRDIAKEIRMSLRDISIILRKNQVSHSIATTKGDDNNNFSNDINIKSLNQKATQAYKLFSEGKKLSDVAIELGLREKEASKLFSEFLRLNDQQELYDIYLDEKYYLRSLLKLHRLLKREGMATADNNNNIEWFVNMVKTGAYKIPEIQNQYAKAKDELEVIEYKRVMSKHTWDNMNNQIILLRRNMYQLSTACNNKRNEIAYLQNQIQVLAGHINGLKSRNQQRQQQEEIQNEFYTGSSSN